MFDQLILGGPLRSPGHTRYGHLECPGRADAALRGVEKLQLGRAVLEVSPRKAVFDEICLVHEAKVFSHLGEMSNKGGGQIDADTFVTESTFTDALFVVGTGLDLVNRVGNTDCSTGLLIARPPGHHATKDQSMGFCLFNNIAIAAAHLRDQGNRVAIVDWDVHHGNGTQDIFFETPEVLYISTHQWPLYPGTGTFRELGKGAGFGTTINIPLPKGSTGDVFEAAFESIVVPRINQFSPQWLLISAGFDAHVKDPLANLGLESEDFGYLMHILLDSLSQSTKIATFLEGGYNFTAIEESMQSVLGIQFGTNPVTPRSQRGVGLDAVRQIERQIANLT